MFKFFSQKTPLERAQEHIRQVTTTSTSSRGSGPTPSSSAGKNAAQEAHERFCEECDKKKTEILNCYEAAANRRDVAEMKRLDRDAGRCDIDAINDGRKVLGIKERVPYKD